MLEVKTSIYAKVRIKKSKSLRLGLWGYPLQIFRKNKRSLGLDTFKPPKHVAQRKSE